MGVRVCIADGHPLVLTGIRGALENADGIEVVGATQHGEEVVALVEEQRPDLLLLDHGIFGTGGIAGVKLLRERHPQIKVVLLSASEEPAQIAEMLGAGACAYIGKRIDPRDLPSALRQIVAGVVYHAGPVTAEPDVELSDLTKRELTMLQAISRGLSTKAISRELWVSEKTVKFHLTNVYRKLGVHNRVGAMRCAYERGLIAWPPLAEVGPITALVAGMTPVAATA